MMWFHMTDEITHVHYITILQNMQAKDDEGPNSSR